MSAEFIQAFSTLSPAIGIVVGLVLMTWILAPIFERVEARKAAAAEKNADAIKNNTDETRLTREVLIGINAAINSTGDFMKQQVDKGEKSNELLRGMNVSIEAVRSNLDQTIDLSKDAGLNAMNTLSVVRESAPIIQLTAEKVANIESLLNEVVTYVRAHPAESARFATSLDALTAQINVLISELKTKPNGAIEVKG